MHIKYKAYPHIEPRTKINLLHTYWIRLKIVIWDRIFKIVLKYVKYGQITVAACDLN